MGIRDRAGANLLAMAASLALACLSILWLGAGPAHADTVTVSNPAAITVPASGSQGPGSPYPSPITVSGMTGTVSDVNVTLNTVTHPITQDLDVLLVGPAGQNLLLMSDAASGGGFGISNATLVFDDSAASTIPTSGVISAGTHTYRPTNADNGGADTFPAPAPAPSTATTLSVFNGTNPNGDWRLFTVDDTDGDVGSIGGGWSMTITTGTVAQPGVLQFTASTFRGAEGQGPVTLTLQRVGGTDAAVSVTVATGTPATATPGIDFTPLNQTVSFADGQATASVPLTILNDTAVEGVDETVTVSLSNPVGGATLGSPSTAVVSIDDNDATFDTTPITIPATGTGTTSGAPAAPYPARIHVTGAPSVIGGVEVTITGLSHQVPIDVDILLVGPGGQNVMLMSDVGGQNAVSEANRVNLTFTDAAPGRIPAGGPLVSGRYAVSDDDTNGTDAFPAPAPTPSSATSLAAFEGTNPNGVWSLYVVDDASGDIGSISGGWSLTFLPAVVPSAGGPYTVAEGQPLTLDGSATVAPAGATYAWDLDGDTQFDDAAGVSPTLSAATLSTLGLGDGPVGRTITLQVTATPTVRTATTTVTVANTPPTASVIGVPSAVVAGTPAGVDFAATDPAAADASAGFTYTIDWGDASPTQSVTAGVTTTVAHTYAAAGNYLLSVTATDKDGGTGVPATTTIRVQGQIVADAGGPYSVAEGGTLTLDGTGSAAGPTASYAWDVDGDGQFDDATGPTPSIDPTGLQALGLGDGPAAPGQSVIVSLRVTEGTQSATSSATLTVTDTAPTVSVAAPPSVGIAGSPVNVTLGATDPSPADVTAGFTYQIDWGDGTPAQSVSGGASAAIPHTYASAGAFTVSVTATDKDGGTSTAATAAVTVVAAVVAEAGGPYTVAEGQGLTLDGTGSAAGVTASYAWDVDGDGQFDDATGPTPSINAATLQALGLGDGPSGPLTVSLQVTDGTQTSTDPATLTIVNTAPTAAVVSVPPGIVAGSATTVSFAATDPAAADVAAGFTYLIDWGDGIPAQPVPGGASADVQHTYATAGTFTISVTATDKDGATSAAATASITVVAAVVADAGGPYAIAEGESLTLDGTGSTAGPTASYAWDLDADGQFDEATGPTPTFSPAQLAALGLADGPNGPVPISLRVTDGTHVDIAGTTYTIRNVAPVAIVQLPGPVVAGVPSTVKFSADDPSPTDAAGQFEYRIDWEGDGVIDDVVTGPADPPVAHTYASPGNVALTVIAVDKDGAASTPTSSSVTVSPASPPAAQGTAAGEAAAGATTASGLPSTGADLATAMLTVATLIPAGVLLMILAGRRRRLGHPSR